MSRLSQPEQGLTLVDQATRELREDILAGVFADGCRLLLAPLAVRLGMSVIPVREALKRLELEGLVDHVPHSGARVRPVSVAELEELYHVRAHLECHALAEAALRITGDDRGRLLDVLDDYRRALGRGDAATAQANHAMFHLGLYELASSEWLMRAIRPLVEASERYQRMAGGLRGDPDTRYDEHRALLETCAAGESTEAASALRKHLDRSLGLIRGQVALRAAPDASQPT